MREHRCTFDSHYGYLPGHRNQALMCRCGNWAMAADGQWGIVPKELLPEACTTLTWFYRMFQFFTGKRAA